MGIAACVLAAQAIEKVQAPEKMRNDEAPSGDYEGAYGKYGHGRQGGTKKFILSHREIQDEDSLSSVHEMAQL